MGRRPPPPPPPPQRQPEKREKEESMYYRNLSFGIAIEAAKTAYTAALTVKILADRLAPITEARLREAINDHFVIASDFYRAITVYSTTEKTFLHVDGIIASSLDKLDMIKKVGEVNIESFDNNFTTVLNEYEKVISYEANLDAIHTKSYQNLELIKSILQDAYTDPTKYEAADAIIEKREAEKLSDTADAVVRDARIAEEKATDIMMNNSYLNTAREAKNSAYNMNEVIINMLEATTISITNVYEEAISELDVQLGRKKRLYEFYKDQAQKVQNPEEIVLSGDIFLQLLVYAGVAYDNAVSAAVSAKNADTYAYQDVHYPL